ncbi:MAG: FAD-binding oxidoreductase [Desulfomonile tiedjei]|nr:FAD-binding oxidoreductase [Desulfomonile tiedjei]
MKTELVERLIEICGAENILHSPEAIELYSRCTIPWSRTCGAVALPESVEQVSCIVRLCNEFKIPLWAFSRGHNWGYGTVLALQEGALIVILRRMNRIHEVNEELCYAVIEPGVSQGQLNEHLKSRGSGLWIDSTDSSPDGSLIGNALDKGVGYTPYGDHFGNLCGMEVVLPSGEIITTGGLPEHCPTRHTYKWGVGPFVEGLFAQSNLGLVTKAGLWLMPKPEAFEMFVVEIFDSTDLAPVIDSLRELALRRIISSCHGFNQFLVLARAFEYPAHLLNGKQFLSETDIQQFAADQGLASWTFAGGVYGTSRQVKANKAEMLRHLPRRARLRFFGETSQRILSRVVRGVREPGVRGALFRCLKSLTQLIFGKVSTEMIESLLSLYPILKGEPNENILAAAYFKNKDRQPAKDLDPARDGCGLIFFAPILPARGNDLQSLIEDIKRICATNGFEAGILLIQPNPRTFFVILPLIFDKKNLEETQRAQRTYDQLCELIERDHYQQYRCCTPQMEKILACNPCYRHLMKTIKEAVDPNQVIAPGRYGI